MQFARSITKANGIVAKRVDKRRRILFMYEYRIHNIITVVCKIDRFYVYFQLNLQKHKTAFIRRNVALHNNLTYGLYAYKSLSVPR